MQGCLGKLDSTYIILQNANRVGYLIFKGSPIFDNAVSSAGKTAIYHTFCRDDAR